MPRRVHASSWWRIVLAVIVAASVSVPATGIAQDFDTVKKEKENLEQRIDEVTADLDDLRARIFRTKDELASLEDRTVQLEQQARSAQSSLVDRARTSFMGSGGSMSTIESLVSADGPSSAVERASILAALSRRDVGALEEATALRTEIAQTRDLLEAKQTELADLQRQMQERSAALQEEFESISVLYRDLKERKDRQTKISNGAQEGIYACIFAGAFHYRDTWGAPRSGGRSHQGTDVFAPYGAPVYAFTTGRISRMTNSGLGGIGLYIWGDDGVEYYYAHLSSFADSAYVGKRVEAGELVAYNGATGNADRWAPHVHFEVHPGGSTKENPYPWLTPVC